MICYNCKPPVLMNTPFTELPAPKRTHRLAIVATWNPIEQPMMTCERTGCQETETNEISECPVCGRWMCDGCFGYEGCTITLDYQPTSSNLPEAQCCIDCSKLTSDERQAIMDLRTKLNQP